jgi:hypothetical protein
MITMYRLQFLGDSAAYGATVLIETSIAAGSIEDAITYAAETEWPPGAAALRLVDLDGREVCDLTKVDRSFAGRIERS